MSAEIRTFTVRGNKIRAKDVIDGIPVNPVTPRDRRHEERPATERATWWYLPYVVQNDYGYWFVYRMDGGAWDRATGHGHADTLEEAIEMAKAL